MADCCDAIAARLSALESVVGAIKVPSASEIIAEAVNEAVGTVKGLIPGLVTPLIFGIVTQKVAPLQSEIFGLGRMVNYSYEEALAAKAEADALQAEVAELSAGLTEVGGVASTARSVANSAQNTAVNAANTANVANSVASNAFAKVLGLAGIVTGILASVAVLELLGSRIDAIEQGLQLLGAQVSGILGKLLGLSGRVDYAISEAGNASARAQSAEAHASAAEGSAAQAQSTANRAQNTANTALGDAHNASLQATQAQAVATNAQGTANTSLTTANKAQATADTAESTATNAGNTAARAQATADEALRQTKVPGPKGEQGIQGVQGKQGLQGPQGIQGAPGPKGDKGQPGVQGIPGVQGTPGMQGTDGKNGIQGAPGKSGLPGIAGPVGLQGPQGIQGIPGKDGKDGKDAKDMTDEDRAKLNNILTTVGLIVAGVSTIAGKLPETLSSSTLSNAAASGVCQTSRPGGCLAKSLQSQADDLKNSIQQKGDDLYNKLNTGFIASQSALLVTINNKLGPFIPGGIGTYITVFKTAFDKFQSWNIQGRAMEYLNLILTIQIAWQLTEGLSVITGQTIANGLAILGLKDPDGKPIDIVKNIGTSVGNFIDSVTGNSTSEAFQLELKTANKIFNSAANVLNAIQNMFFSVTNALNVIGSWTGQIGDALKKWGVVGHNAYPWMNPAPNFHNPLFTGLFQANNIISQINIVTQTILQGRTQIEETDKQLQDLRDNLVNVVNDPVPDNAAYLKKYVTAVPASKGATPTPADIAHVSGQ